MSTAAAAVTTVESATTPQTETPQQQTPSTPEFNAADQSTWSHAQRAEWNKTGAQPTKAESATATESKDKKDPAAPDSAPDKKKAADSASDSATDKQDQKPHLKTKEDTERRIQQLLDENKDIKKRLEAAERAKPSEPRETKQASQPAPEVYKPLDEKEFFKGNPAAGQQGHKTYEDFVRAAAKHEAKWEVKQELALENQRRATEAAQKDLQVRVDEAKKIYPDFDERVQPTVKAIMDDQQIPFAVKAVLNDSPVFEHLLYTIGDPAALKDLIQTARTNPAAAIRKIVLTETLVQAELAKAKEGKGGDKGADKGTDKGGDAAQRDASGKFVSSDKKDAAASEPKPRAPKPPTEVGGRGTASEDGLVTAAKANDFKAFEAEEWRRKRASAS